MLPSPTKRGKIKLKISGFFSKLLGLLHVLEVIYRIRVHTHVVVSAPIEPRLSRGVKRVLPGRVLGLLELIHFLFDVALVFDWVHGLGHELAHKSSHLAHGNSSDFVRPGFAGVQHLFSFLF